MTMSTRIRVANIERHCNFSRGYWIIEWWLGEWNARSIIGEAGNGEEVGSSTRALSALRNDSSEAELSKT